MNHDVTVLKDNDVKLRLYGEASMSWVMTWEDAERLAGQLQMGAAIAKANYQRGVRERREA